VYQISPYSGGLYNPELLAKVLIPKPHMVRVRRCIEGTLHFACDRSVNLGIFGLFSDAAQEKVWLHWQSAEHTEKRDVASLTHTESSLREKPAEGNDGNLPLPQECGHTRCSIAVSTLLFFLQVSS
jgi:hypothetical protein